MCIKWQRKTALCEPEQADVCWQQIPGSGSHSVMYAKLNKMSSVFWPVQVMAVAVTFLKHTIYQWIKHKKWSTFTPSRVIAAATTATTASVVGVRLRTTPTSIQFSTEYGSEPPLQVYSSVRSTAQNHPYKYTVYMTYLHVMTINTHAQNVTKMSPTLGTSGSTETEEQTMHDRKCRRIYENRQFDNKW